jgi:hypothetical protein
VVGEPGAGDGPAADTAGRGPSRTLGPMPETTSGGSPSIPFTGLHDRARRVGEWVWLERRTFEVMGRWAGTSDPASGVLFGEMSRRHGWHSEVLFDRLPELASVDADALVRAPGPATEALFEALDASASTLDRLVGAYRVLVPTLVGEYRSTVATLSPVAEASLARWLGIVVRDDVEEWCRGDAELRAALVDDDAVRAAGARQVELDLLAAASAGLTG